jgi:hypothetical protein
LDEGLHATLRRERTTAYGNAMDSTIITSTIALAAPRPSRLRSKAIWNM